MSDAELLWLLATWQRQWAADERQRNAASPVGPFAPCEACKRPARGGGLCADCHERAAQLLEHMAEGAILRVSK